jgi:uncharacterized phage protein gp47/JayE
MPWPILTPATIASNAAAVYENTPALQGIDARSANSVAAANTRIIGLTAYDLYLYQGYIAQQVMPDTATDWLYRHGNIWGVPQLQPTPATGNGVATSTGLIEVSIPTGTLATGPTGALYMVTATAAIAVGSTTVSAPVVASVSGSGGNLPGGSTLTLVSPIAGLVAQQLVLDSNGAANGTNLESTTSWQSRILLRIRTPPQGGAAADYVEWAQAAGAGYVNVITGWFGPGSVGVCIAAPGGIAASEQLVAAVQASIGIYGVTSGLRPVTANAGVFAATLVPVPVSISLNPDTTAIRAAATQALTLFFAQFANTTQLIQQSALGTAPVVYVSRLDNALSSADGEFNHERQLPAADVNTFTPGQLPVLGTITFTDPT